MRGKLALFFAYLTALMLALALSTPWFKWENRSGFQPNGGDRVLCWIDATCRTNSDTNTLIFKGGFRAQRFYDATLMLLVIPGVLFFFPLLWSIHALRIRTSLTSKLAGGLARGLILLFGIITLLCWLAAIILFSQGIEERYRPCDFQSNIPQWGCAGPNQGEPAENNRLHELYGSRDIALPIVIETIFPNGTATTSSGFATQHVEWGVLSGWYFAMLAALFLLPTILLGLFMRNKRNKVVTQTTATTATKENYLAPQQVGRAPVMAPATGYSAAPVNAAPNVVRDTTYAPATRV